LSPRAEGRPARRRGHWFGLRTESRNPRSRRLDTLPTREIVRLLLDEDRRAVAAAQSQAGAVARAAALVAKAIGGGGTVAFAGAGTSGRLGVLEAAECPPTFGTSPRILRGIMAGGPEAVFRSREGAEDRHDRGLREGRRLRRGDVLVGISASSVTPFVRGAIEGARARGAKTVLVTCAARPGLRGQAEVVIAIPTGPEVLTGSTRMKAGSATKAVLNAITTAAMVRLGKVYENLMVDMQPSNAKLRDRARRIVSAAAHVSEAEAERLLTAAGDHPKTAIVMGRLGISRTAARRRLRQARGHVRRALGKA
jgi:N-acetylmuramic acid 6-phosphate etherase